MANQIKDEASEYSSLCDAIEGNNSVRKLVINGFSAAFWEGVLQLLTTVKTKNIEYLEFVRFSI